MLVDYNVYKELVNSIRFSSKYAVIILSQYAHGIKSSESVISIEIRY